MSIEQFLNIYTLLEIKYGDDFRRLTGIEQKNLIEYDKKVGVDNLSSNLYIERPNFLPQ
jgi:hypothetical protein